MIDHNVAVLTIAAKELQPLLNELVFVGGSTVGLYITDVGVPEVRATIDVDCVIELTSRIAYYNLEEQLRNLGFLNMIDGPTCRWRKNSLILDVMPTDEAILGFSNKWYSEGIRYAVKTKLNDELKISIFSIPYFLGSKLEAFKGRGKDDYRLSHDIEDIITILDGSEEAVNEVRAAQGDIGVYLKEEFSKLLKNSDFIESVEGHISDRQNTHYRAKIVLEKIREIVKK